MEPVIIKTAQADGTELRKFADLKLRESVDKVLSSLKPEENVAIIADARFGGGSAQLKAGLMFRFDNGWSFAGVLNKDFPGGWSGEAVLIKSFKL